MSVELGSGRLIPGFEDQLVGAKAGDEPQAQCDLPGRLSGRRTRRARTRPSHVTVKAVKTAGETKIDDEFAKALGLQSLDQLQGPDPRPAEQELNGLTRTHMKRQLLDQLADASRLRGAAVDGRRRESRTSSNQLRHEASHEEDPQAALAEIEKDAAEYRRIAERRVRLGLLLSEIGAANGVEVSEQEMSA